MFNNKRSPYIFLYALITCWMFLFFSPHVYASCSGTTGVMNIDIGTITVSDNAQNSVTKLYKEKIGNESDVETMADISCATSSFSYVGHVIDAVPGTDDLTKVMLTDGSWSGLGFKFYTKTKSGWYSALNISPPNTGHGTWNKYCFYSTCWDPSKHDGVVMWGNVSVYGGGVPAVPGEIDTILHSVFTVDGYDAIDFHITGTIVAPTCSVDTTTPTNINLGSADLNDISEVGDSTNSKDFNIVLNCSGSSKVYMTIISEEDSDASGKAVLAPLPSSTATGVGVQLLYNSLPAILNKEFFIKDSESTLKIPFTARMYRTKTRATSGSLSAKVEYIFNYQ